LSHIVYLQRILSAVGRVASMQSKAARMFACLLALPRQAAWTTMGGVRGHRAYSSRAFAAAMKGGVAKPRGPKAKQSLGQNFLHDASLARRIAESCTGAGGGGEQLIELGPGQGAITAHLLPLYPRMHAVELDQRMVDVLHRDYPTLSVEHGDMLEFDLAERARERGAPLSLVSNTPYYLTSPLLFKLLASVEHVDSAVLTMQKEVAEKVMSAPCSKKYGILSVMLQLFARPTYLFDIPPEAFEPAPKVVSSVLRFEPTPTPPGEAAALSVSQRAAVLAVLKLTFEARRKMLRSSLRPLLETGAVTRPDETTLALRPEQISPAGFLELTRTLFGEEFGESNGALLERHAVSKAWRAHKAGWRPKHQPK
jgi:16S rRNA (adenine1518-N6/adenine1519-N6)-dimethyltransferase